MGFTWRILFYALILIKTVENAPERLNHLNHEHSHNSPEDKGLFEQYTDLFDDVSATDKERSDIIDDHLVDFAEIAKLCPRNEFFHNMNHDHLKAISMLTSIFAETNTTRKFLRLAKGLRDREEIHPKVWYQALVAHSYENPELQQIRKFTPIEIMPDVFITSFTLQKARDLEIERRKGFNRTETTKLKQTCPTVDETVGRDNGDENELWYFREDLMLNSHHWFFHVIYPFRLERKNRHDRFGELFYYMHQSLLARYNTERLSVWLEKAQPLYPSVGGVIEEGYAPHLRDDISGRLWTNRIPFAKFVDVKFTGNDVYVDKMLVQTWQRILEAIERGYLDEGNGKKVPLVSTTDGIDVLSDVVQGTNFSMNLPVYSGNGYYGLHNNGHLVLGRTMDPTAEKKLPPGVMSETATAMRDPIFYRWHTFVNDLLDKYKKTLPPYMPKEGDHQLLWSGIIIRDLFVTSQSTGQAFEPQPNELRTFWRTRTLKVTRGLDFFRPQGSVPAEICVKHLDHDEFTYHFVIERKENVEVSSATIRIFLAPREDTSGTQFTLEEQRGYFFVLDTFKTELTPGLNNFTRHSTKSSLTIPWSQSLEEVEVGNSTAWLSNSQKNQYCGCGFPHHLLLPKSRPSGQLFDLFVMVTNAEEDLIEETGKQSPIEFCQPAYLYCGVVGQKYPDAKPMGYPFDRLPYTSIVTDSGDTKSISTLDDYVEDISNMATVQVNIVLDEEPEDVASEEE